MCLHKGFGDLYSSSYANGLVLCALSLLFRKANAKMLSSEFPLIQLPTLDQMKFSMYWKKYSFSSFIVCVILDVFTCVQVTTEASDPHGAGLQMDVTHLMWHETCE